MNLIGKQFGRWTVLAPGTPRKANDGKTLHYWLCRCVCGKERSVLGKALRAGTSTSCGCFQRERSSETAQRLHREGTWGGDGRPRTKLPHTPLHLCRSAGLPMEAIQCNPFGGWEEAA